MRIVVTGATGNLGTSCVSAFAADPDVSEIVAIARRPAQLGIARTRFVPADVAQNDLRRWFVGADVVVHLAWEISASHDEKRLRRTNVEGSERVFEAAAKSGVKALLYSSSVGVYSAGPAERERRVDESWPREGVASSLYSSQKAEVERKLDDVERRFPDLRVVRMRPALVFKASAASRVQRLFLGKLFPPRLLKPGSLPFIPSELQLQCVHSHDVGAAFLLAAKSEVHGAFNLAADPVLPAPALADLLGTRTRDLSPKALRALVAFAFRARLVPSEPGWIDLAFSSPLLTSERATRELGWHARHSAADAFLEVVQGIRDGRGFGTPPLEPRKKPARGGVTRHSAA
jgi:UDP-glucose 4-epimerase